MNIRVVTLLLSVALASQFASAQQPDRAAVARQVEAHVKEVYEAAARFLNKGSSVPERLKAIEPYSVIFDKEQIAAFRQIALDREEQLELRAAALDKIFQNVTGDEALEAATTEWLSNPQVPLVLRREALKLEGDLSFRSGAVRELYQKLLDDPELEFRVFAFTKLVAHGDARAQQLLIRGLQDPKTARVAPPIAIGILNMAEKKEYYPALLPLVQNKEDAATRLEAIRAIGSYEPARQVLVAISRDAAEKPEFREAALGALYSGDRDNIVEYVAPILQEVEGPARLKAIGIQMTIDVRQTSAHRFKNRKADSYDQLVRKVAGEARDPALKAIAGKYLDAVRPGF